jgi:hypothetical protein
MKILIAIALAFICAILAAWGYDEHATAENTNAIILGCRWVLWLGGILGAGTFIIFAIGMFVVNYLLNEDDK